MGFRFIEQGAFQVEWFALPAMENQVKRTREASKDGNDGLVEYHKVLEKYFDTRMCLNELNSFIGYFLNVKDKIGKYMAGELYYEPDLLEDPDEIPSIWEELEFYFDGNNCDYPLNGLTMLSQTICANAVALANKMDMGFELFFCKSLAEGSTIKDEFEQKMAKKLEEIEAQGNFPEFVARMQQAGELVKNKGDVQEILKLMH